ncbi:MAG: tRNA (adenine-N1)-methyltransferase [Candidatus Bathyarchaeota archaeon]
MPHEKIREDNYILLYLDKRRTYLVKVKKGENFHTHKGFVNYDDIIGREYGSKIPSSLGVEFIVLKPILRDFIMKSPRRTQITYPKDAALIVMFSGIEPGSIVVEAGTGSAALTIALAHYVRPNGRIFSYDNRKEFSKNAQKNLERSGITDFVTLKNQDITEGIDEKDVDAVILDLATPWLVTTHAHGALKPSGSLVSFSPTLDQVVKTVETLKEHHFVEVETIECLLRRMQIERGRTRPQTLMRGHTGYITFARKTAK